MRVRVIAVGTRMPAWVRSACAEYLQRLRGGLALELEEIATASRRAAQRVLSPATASSCSRRSGHASM
jgi:23S rRNA (pseudouridine1915-N3)-methyltransferase